MSKIPAIDQSKLTEEDKVEVTRAAKQGKQRGIGNGRVREASPTYEKARAEKIFSDGNNNFIIMGRDRPTHPRSGFGAMGATEAGRIDLIAGLASSFPHKDGTFGPPNRKTIVNPNFAMDGARIYISQKANIDQYMGLSSVPRESGAGSSAIGMKADAIRIHARQDIKIVTGRGSFANQGVHGERLSHGGKNEVVGTISLIAGNHGTYLDDPAMNMFSHATLQPLVKGDNLTKCLKEMFSLMEEIYTCVSTNTINLNALNITTGAHIHNVLAPVPVPVIPSVTQLPFAAFLSSMTMGEQAAQAVLKRRISNIATRYIKLGESAPEPPINISSKHVFTT